MLLNTSGNATRNACHADVRLGDASNKASINPAGRTIYDTDGATAVLTWDLSAWLLYFSATNRWDATQFLVDASGAITLDAGAALTLTAVAASTWTFTNKVDWTVGAASNWTFTGQLDFNCVGGALDIEADGVNIIDRTGNTNTLNIGLGGGLWADIHILSTDMDIVAANLDVGTNGSPCTTLDIWTAALNFNGEAGVDITNWTTKGGLTGTGVTAMTIQVPDGSGGTKDIEILARAL
jgi:hypothetical protein